MTTIGVIGSNSMVGSRFCEQTKLNIVKADLNGEIAVDITNRESVENFIDKHKTDAIVLFSAFTDADAAEKQRNDKNGICWNINVGGVENFVSNIKDSKVKLVLISTDYVFDGSNGPYSESDTKGGEENKISWYGLTKLEAEKVVEENLKNWVILRITYPYRADFEGKLDFARTILKRESEGNLYPMFSDQIFTPTYIDDVAPALDLILEKDMQGIFHVASPTTTTPYDFAKKILEANNRETSKLQKGSLIEFLKKPGSTPRPIKGGLKVEKIKGLGFEPTSWDTGIDLITKTAKIN